MNKKGSISLVFLLLFFVLFTLILIKRLEFCWKGDAELLKQLKLAKKKVIVEKSLENFIKAKLKEFSLKYRSSILLEKRMNEEIKKAIMFLEKNKIKIRLEKGRALIFCKVVCLFSFYLDGYNYLETPFGKTRIKKIKVSYITYAGS